MITTGPAAAGPTTMALNELGQSQTLQLSAAPSSTNLLIPVPAGLHPSRLTGSIEVAAGGTDGVLEIVSGDRRLASVDLAGKAGKDVDLTVPLTDAPVVDGAVGLTVRLNDRDGRCRLPGTRATQLRALAASFTGTDAAPTAVANFLPPVLQRMTLVVPDDVDQSVGRAATRLAGAVAARYQPATPDIAVRTASTATDQPTGLDRMIIFSGTGDPELGLEKDTRQLRIDGTGDDLQSQIAALTDDLGRIASANRATASGRSSVPQLRPATQTLTQLGLGAQSAEGAGSVTTDLGIDAGRVGRTGPGWDLRLTGTVTSAAPRAADGSQGSLVLAAGGRTLKTWPLTSGPLDLTASVPRNVIGPFTTLSLTAQSTGDSACNSRPVVSLEVDPGSTLTVRPGPTTPTLTQLPALLQPRYAIASSRSGVAGLADSVSTAVALQRTTNAALAPVWQPSVSAAKDFAGPSVLLAGTAELPTGLRLPVTLGKDSVSVPGGRTLDGAVRVGVLQVARQGGRIVVVRQATDDKIDTSFADWLESDDQLSGLSSSAAVWNGSGQPTTFTADASGATAATGSGAVPRTWWAAIGGAVGGALIVGLAVFIVMTVRRRGDRQRPAPDDHRSATAGPNDDDSDAGRPDADRPDPDHRDDH